MFSTIWKILAIVLRIYLMISALWFVNWIRNLGPRARSEKLSKFDQWCEDYSLLFWLGAVGILTLFFRAGFFEHVFFFIPQDMLDASDDSITLRGSFSSSCGFILALITIDFLERYEKLLREKQKSGFKDSS